MISQFELMYQIAPIILTRGSYGSGMSIISLLGGLDNLDNAFARFQPLPGGSLVEQTIGQYPFANQSIAGNAIIRQPLSLSLIMITPMSQANAWSTKLNKMTALKAALDSHNNAGGTYTVMTPAYTYIDLVMISLVDASTGETVLPQNAWRWDFQKPLISLADSSAAQNNMMSKISQSLPTTPSDITSGGATVGNASLLNTSLTTPAIVSDPVPLGQGGIGTEAHIADTAPAPKGS